MLLSPHRTSPRAGERRPWQRARDGAGGVRRKRAWAITACPRILSRARGEGRVRGCFQRFSDVSAPHRTSPRSGRGDLGGEREAVPGGVRPQAGMVDHGLSAHPLPGTGRGQGEGLFPKVLGRECPLTVPLRSGERRPRRRARDGAGGVRQKRAGVITACPRILSRHGERAG